MCQTLTHFTFIKTGLNVSNWAGITLEHLSTYSL